MSRLPLSRPVALVLATLGLFASVLVASPASAAREPLIQGVVVDQSGRPVLGVKVQAYDESGEPAAADESYENTTADGDPQRGYFALRVGDLGSYTVVLSKKGYFSETLEGITLRRRARVAGLGEVELTKRPFATKVGGKLTDATVTPRDKAKVTVTVTCPEGCESIAPTGKVLVKDGRRSLGSATLTAAHKGKVTITLPRLDKGSYDLKAAYEGAPYLKPSVSKTFTLTVKKPNRSRPNAGVWLG